MQKFFDYLLNIIIIAAVVAIVFATLQTPDDKYSKKITDITAEGFTPEKLADPDQSAYRGNEHIPFEHGDLSVKIYPRANYKIYAMVMSKKHYSFGWESNLSPYDLALAWNKLMLPEYQREIEYNHGNRWYFFRYSNNFPLPASYVYRHSANTHIIPSTSGLKKFLDLVRVRDKVYMEGYLVNVNGKKGKDTVWWNSSLTRDDRGDGACEILYLKKAILGDRVFE